MKVYGVIGWKNSGKTSLMERLEMMGKSGKIDLRSGVYRTT